MNPEIRQQSVVSRIMPLAAASLAISGFAAESANADRVPTPSEQALIAQFYQISILENEIAEPQLSATYPCKDNIVVRIASEQEIAAMPKTSGIGAHADGLANLGECTMTLNDSLFTETPDQPCATYNHELRHFVRNDGWHDPVNQRSLMYVGGMDPFHIDEFSPGCANLNEKVVLPDKKAVSESLKYGENMQVRMCRTDKLHKNTRYKAYYCMSNNMLGPERQPYYHRVQLKSNNVYSRVGGVRSSSVNVTISYKEEWLKNRRAGGKVLK